MLLPLWGGGRSTCSVQPASRCPWSSVSPWLWDFRLFHGVGSVSTSILPTTLQHLTSQGSPGRRNLKPTGRHREHGPQSRKAHLSLEWGKGEWKTVTFYFCIICHSQRLARSQAVTGQPSTGCLTPRCPELFIRLKNCKESQQICHWIIFSLEHLLPNTVWGTPGWEIPARELLYLFRGRLWPLQCKHRAA